MSRVHVAAAALLAGTLLGGRAARADDGCDAPGAETLPGCLQVVVEYDPVLFDAPATAARHDLEWLGGVPQVSLAVFQAREGTDVRALALTLETSEPGVVEAERNEAFTPPDCVQRNVAILEYRPGGEIDMLRQPAVRLLAPPDAPGPNEILVAVVDAGVDGTHPALQGRVVPGEDLVDPGASGADAHDGIDGDGDGDLDEGWGHGTAAAGIIHSIAPTAAVVSVRVLDDECHGHAIDVAAGIADAVDRGARIINVSLALSGESESIEAAVEYALAAGALVVAPAGNAGVAAVAFPASAEETLAVAAVDEGRVAPSWASHGEAVDLVAPGVAVLTSYRGGLAEVSGSSFSAAMVSGVAAALLAEDPTLTGTDLRALLRASATPVDAWNPFLAGQLGAGLPSVEAALARLPWAGTAVGEHEDDGEHERDEELPSLRVRLGLSPVSDDARDHRRRSLSVSRTSER